MENLPLTFLSSVCVSFFPSRMKVVLTCNFLASLIQG